MRILITGEKSYVGLSFKKWLEQWPNKYRVDTVSLKTDNWKYTDLSEYNVILHVAAIVHQKELPSMKNYYTKINRDLTLEFATKAKQSGVKQFIFMSTMSVYGLEGNMLEDIIIDGNTPCNPNTLYGQNKLEAEVELEKLKSSGFNIAIIRAPMIYGPNCPGNYTRLRKLILRSPIFPKLNNERSMLFIDNLSEFIRLLIENNDQGLFFPQNKEFVNTLNLVQIITRERLKKIHYSRLLAIAINLLGNRIKLVNKMFGNLKYDSKLSSYKNWEYCVVNFEDSIRKSENYNCEGK